MLSSNPECIYNRVYILFIVITAARMVAELMEVNSGACNAVIAK
jgi:hypothetical protein